MKKKVGTILDEELLWEAKKTAIREKKSLSHLLEDALKGYLKKSEKDKRSKGIVKRTRGIMKLRPRDLKIIMEEEGVYDT